MHDWLEGVLQHHFRHRWGFKGKEKKNSGKKKQVQHDSDDSDSEISMTGAWNEDFDLKVGTDASLFSESELMNIQQFLKHVVLPSGVEPIPKNLGDVSHGKLKAIQWKSLFLYVIPLIILELLVLDVEDFLTLSTRHTIIRNIASLVQCTQIVLGRTTNQYNIDQFEKMYTIYCETSAKLYNNIKVVPNHHYVLHIPQMMQYWGPLMGVSEFAGEHINGLMQKFKTNHMLGKLVSIVVRKNIS